MKRRQNSDTKNRQQRTTTNNRIGGSVTGGLKLVLPAHPFP